VEEISGRMEEKQYSISYGIVSAAAEGLDMNSLVKRADTNMYRAKEEYMAKRESTGEKTEADNSADTRAECPAMCFAV
jgi:GGDEF domain.